ncbi:MAG: hypothetical protein ACRD3O_03420 [Terriglobia bacterium]
MANTYNTNPIYLDTDTTEGWKSLQTLSTNPVGILPQKVVLIAAGTTAAGTVTVTDPTGSNVLLTLPVTTDQAPIILDFESMNVAWRDFKVTGLTATVTALQIWYRI